MKIGILLSKKASSNLLKFSMSYVYSKWTKLSLAHFHLQCARMIPDNCFLCEYSKKDVNQTKTTTFSLEASSTMFQKEPGAIVNAGSWYRRSYSWAPLCLHCLLWHQCRLLFTTGHICFGFREINHERSFCWRQYDEQVRKETEDCLCLIIRNIHYKHSLNNKSQVVVAK